MPPLRVGNTADWNLKARARTHWRRTTNGIGSVPREAHKEMRTLTMEQVATMLLPAIREHPLYPAIFLAFSTGLRRGELLALRWQDIDLDAGMVTVK